VQLFDLASGKQTWPPPSTFAAAFPLHPGQHWSDPAMLDRRRADFEAEQARNADFHEQSAREQEARQNRELREQF